MPRRARLFLENTPVHVVQRGNNRQACFYGVEDFQNYMECLQDASLQEGCDVHAYVLMTNHVHLLATPHTPLEFAENDAGYRQALCTLDQQSLRSHWHALGGPVQNVVSTVGRLCIDVLSIYRDESSAKIKGVRPTPTRYRLSCTE